jgi:hypothetical protein
VKTFTFGIRLTPKGAVGWMQPPNGRLAEKRFRNGYAAAEVGASRWIDDQIAIIHEGEICDGHQPATIIDTRKRKPGRPSQGGPTPIRPVRIDDETWQRWKAAAAELGTDVTELIKAGTDREIKVRRRRK